MRKIALLVLAAGLGLAGSASAADLGTAPIYRKAAPAPAFSWTGSYLGLYIGGADGRRVTSDTIVGAAGTVSYDLGSSVIGGYTGGYNLQFAPNWLIGYEGETGYMKVKASTVFPAVPNVNATAEVGSLYSVWSGRVGYVADNSLFYVKGGAVWVRADGGINTVAPAAGVTSGHKNIFGYAAGGGWEYAFAPKWSLKAEYLYLGLDQSFSYATGAGTASTTHIGGIHTGKVGVNYKWDWFSLLR